jgi:2-polyprenyl-3-methyl-5-hydroxy-6-metoxy-1,4-benzoquinol methylase
MSEFDIKAADWDKNPMHWDRSVAIVEEIRRSIPLNRNMTALEYGAGTGIASFLLREDLKEITMMDNSTEMVRIMKEKIEAANVPNIKVLNFDLEHDDPSAGRFDVIFTQMVLHHVADIESVIDKFGKMLNAGGFLAIADLYKEDGSFHGEGFSGHNGFDPESLSAILGKNSFRNIAHRPCFIIDRKISELETKHYEVFLLTANYI